VKLFSITCAMKKEAKIVCKGMQLMVKNGMTKLTFKKCLETQSSFVVRLEIKPKTSNLQGMQGKVKKWM